MPEYAEELQRKAQQVGASMDGELDVAVEPQTLIDLALDTSEEKLQVERQRVRILLQRAKARRTMLEKVTATGEKAVAVVTAKEKTRPSKAAREIASDDAIPDEAGGLDVRIWRARLKLDRARLAFYLLPAERRPSSRPARRSLRRVTRWGRNYVNGVS